MAQCRSCHRQIIWALTDNRKPMPVDRDPVPNGNLLLENVGGELRARVVPVGEGTHVSHFATCPHRAQHRRR